MTPEGGAAGGRFEAIRAFLGAHERFLLVTHMGPDGDGLLSCIAFARYLESLGKKATVAAEGPPPSFVFPYDPEGTVRTHTELLAAPGWAERFDAVLALDTGKPSRLGKLGVPVVESGLPVGVIDHHIPEEGDFDGPSAIDKRAASVGEMLADFLDEEGGAAFGDPLILRLLFATIVYDTGQFRFSNTTEKTLRWAARFVELGASPTEPFGVFWESNSPSSVKLQGHLMSRLHLECGGRLAWFSLSKAELERFGVRREETEEYITFPRSISTVEIIAFFSELDGRVRVSLRSKGRVEIHDIAQRFGGGGHAFASGARVAGGLDEITATVIAALTEKLRASLGPD